MKHVALPAAMIVGGLGDVFCPSWGHGRELEALGKEEEMITLDQCKELLETQSGIADVEVCKDQYVRAQFANRVNPKEPHKLIIDPMQDKLVLRVLVPGIAEARSGSGLHQVLQDINYRLLIGKVGTDMRDGDVSFEINHPCQDGTAQDPAPEVFARLIEVAIGTTLDVQLTTVHVGMMDAGIPSDVAKQFVDQFRSREKEEAQVEETL